MQDIDMQSSWVVTTHKLRTTESDPGPLVLLPVFSHQLPLPLGKDEGQIVLSGDSGTAAENTFAVDPDSGFLVATRALDREEKAEYQLQV